MEVSNTSISHYPPNLYPFTYLELIVKIAKEWKY